MNLIILILSFISQLYNRHAKGCFSLEVHDSNSQDSGFFSVPSEDSNSLNRYFLSIQFTLYQ